MLVQIDTREKKRIKKAEKYYTEQGYDVQVQELYTGDYVFDEKVAFEYKTWSDCFGSISDKRLFNESLRQSEKYPYHYVIIVGGDKERQKALKVLYRNNVRFSMKQYYGAIARLNTYTNVIYAPSENKAYKIMKCQAEKCLDSKPLIHRLENKTGNPALNLLYLLDDVSEKRAELIMNELNLKTYKDLKLITYEDLTNIKGIGDKVAKKIIEGIGEYTIKND